MNADAQKYLELVQSLEEAHTRRLIEQGLPEKAARAKASKQANEDARFVLPNACETKMVMTMNCRSLQNFFNLRCCNASGLAAGAPYFCVGGAAVFDWALSGGPYVLRPAGGSAPEICRTQEGGGLPWVS